MLCRLQLNHLCCRLFSWCTSGRSESGRASWDRGSRDGVETLVGAAAGENGGGANGQELLVCDLRGGEIFRAEQRDPATIVLDLAAAEVARWARGGGGGLGGRAVAGWRVGVQVGEWGGRVCAVQGNDSLDLKIL